MTRECWFLLHASELVTITAARKSAQNSRLASRTTPRNTIELLVCDGLHGHFTEFVLRDGRLQGRRSIITDIVIEGVELPVEAVVAERAPCPDAAASTSP